MAVIIVGNPAVFAIESSITEAYERLSQRALGYFVIHVSGKSYGIRSPEATLLACSFDAVRERISRRGMHSVSFGVEPDATRIVDAYLAVTYHDGRQDETFFGMPANAIEEAILSKEIVWAPDGDAAFDDGSHILQFDALDRVRLIAFKNEGSAENIMGTLAEVWVGADEFYGILDDWQRRFEAERVAVLSRP